jgi:hypothetical protein
MTNWTRPLLALALLLAACERGPKPADNAPAAAAQTTADTGKPPQVLAPVEPPAPGTPGGLPDDRTPISEAPFTAESAQGAANVLQTYFALIGEGKYRQAWALWGQGGQASGLSAEAFAASFDKYDSYHAQVGAPGRIEGAAGTLFVEAPVVVYGRLKSGEEVHMSGPMRLSRVNDVPGATDEQRRWHIAASGLRPRP